MTKEIKDEWMETEKREPKIKKHCVGNDNDSLCTHALHCNECLEFLLLCSPVFSCFGFVVGFHHLLALHIPDFHHRFVYFDIGSS